MPAHTHKNENMKQKLLVQHVKCTNVHIANCFEDSFLLADFSSAISIDAAADGGLFD